MKAKPRAGVALLLSLILPGLGQVYGAKPSTGATIYGAYLVLLAAGAYLAPSVAGETFLYGLGVWFFGVRFAAAVDAYRQSKKKAAIASSTGLVVQALIAFVVAGQVSSYVIRQNLIEAFNSPSASMSPTVLVGDQFFVDKRSFEPKRGDLIVFESPENRSADFVKRVVGLPGDLIEMSKGQLSINGVAVDRCELGKLGEQTLFVEKLDGRSHLIAVDSVDGPGDGGERQWRVDHGEYFVMGDNRDNSHDSRNFNGGRGASVPRDHIKARALLVWWAADTDRVGVSLNEITLPRGIERGADDCGL